MPPPIVVKPGDQYGKLTIVEELPAVAFNSGKPNRRFRCQCECGTIKDILFTSLRNGNTTSCGCYGKAQRLAACTTHQETKTREYQAWRNMIARCYNPKSPKYHNYGARGVTVCERWKTSFENFYADMGDRPSDNHSLDRKDSAGHYEPDNCRWATQREQCNNQRTNRLISYNGKTQTCTEWDKELGFRVGTTYNRLHAGWNTEKILTTPPDYSKGNPVAIIAMNYETKSITIYESVEECAMGLDISTRTIWDFLKRKPDKTKPSRGYIFAYMKDQQRLVDLVNELQRTGR